MIKAVFLDVDGTLFSHTIPDIPVSALSALEELQRQGILVCLATGRHPLALARLNLHSFPFDGYVTSTGHLCYDRDRAPVFRAPLPEADTIQLLRAFHDHFCPLMLLHEDQAYINYVDDRVARMMASVSSTPPSVGEFSKKPLYGAAIYCPRKRAELLAERIPGCRLSAWSSTGFDIISRQAGKVRGIKEMMAHFDLCREEIVVFGDADNDVEMISFAGVGVAMGNGTPAARAAADFVAGSVDDDGLAGAFRRLGLISP